MRFLEIGGEHFGTAKLAQLTADGLNGLGLNSFQSIDINIQTNQVFIGFTKLEDATCARAIAGTHERSKSKRFQSNNIQMFILNLFGALNS